MNMFIGLSAATALCTTMTRISMESQMVIGMRVAGMIGLLPQAADEQGRMINEKVAAAHESSYAAMLAATKGGRFDQVLSAALVPIERRTSANAKRLTKGLSH